jgi:hypothetical protein
MVEQVQPYEYWPGGDSKHLAVIARSPENLTDEFRLVFQTDVDDLDTFRIAAIRLSSGEQVWLEQHSGDPSNHVLVLVDITANGQQIIEELIHELGLAADHLFWISPEVSHPPLFEQSDRTPEHP